MHESGWVFCFLLALVFVVVRITGSREMYEGGHQDLSSESVDLRMLLGSAFESVANSALEKKVAYTLTDSFA
jgi:hypothetical protein